MTARSLRAAVATGARSMLAARGTLAIMVFIQMVVVLTMASLWRAAAEANGGEIAGYSATALIWYIVAAEAAVTGILQRLIEQIGDDIAAGTVESELLRPASVVGVRLATELGRGLPRLAVGLVGGTAVAFALGALPPDALALGLMVPSLLLATVVNLSVQHAFAAIAFWLRDIRSTWYLHQKVVFILGGMLIPLEVLPGWLAGIARLLPFAAMAYVPGRLGSGHVEPVLLVVQAAWAVVALIVCVCVFAAGERHLQEVGG